MIASTMQTMSVPSTGHQITLNSRQPAHRQRGVTLIELLVGIAIGLMVVAVATGALLATRGISGTVSDASNIQQQASYAMRVFGQQLRQAGSLHLNLNPSNEPGGSDIQTLAAVGLEIEGDPEDIITENSGKVRIQFARYTEPTFTGSTLISHARNCIGGPDNSSQHVIIESEFLLDGANLKCGGNQPSSNPVKPSDPIAGHQPLIDNVADFELRYLVQDKADTGKPTIQYTKVADVDDWNAVQAVEVCLVLKGTERIDIPSGATYKNCEGEDQAYTGNQMHLLFRNVFQLRSQGLVRETL